MSRRSIPLLVLLVVLLGAGLAIHLLRPPPSGAPSPPPERAPGAAADGVTPPDPPAGSEPGGAVETSPFRETEEAQAPPDGPEARRVEIVHGVLGHPLPGATLHARPGRPGEEHEPGALAADPAAVRRIAGANGVTSVPGEEDLVAVAISGALTSPVVAIPAGQALTRVRLYPVSELRFRVVDADGVPRRGERLDLRAGLGPFRQPVATGAADAEGRVRFAFPELMDRCRVVSGLGAAMGSFSLRAHVSGLFAVNPAEPISLADPPRDEVLIRLPPTGRVVVQLDGPPELIGRVRRVSLRVLDPTEEVDPHAVLRPEVRGFASTRVERSMAVFRDVGIGTKLELSVRAPRRDVAGVRELITGPVEGGDEVFARIAIGQEKPRLSWRLVDPAGRPLRDPEVLTGRFATEDMNPWQTRALPLELDEAGRVTWSPPRRWTPGTKRWLTIRCRLRGGEDPVRLEARVDLSRSYAPGLTELGDLVLQQLPPIAAGRVVDREGRPIPSARVRVRGVLTPEEEVETGISGDARRVLSMTLLFDHTDADGRFAIIGHWEDATVCLAVERKGFVERTTPTVRAHDENLLIVLDPGGRLAGRVLLDNPLQARGMVRMSLRRAKEGSFVDFIQPQATGAFASEDVPPGTYRLSVRWNSRPEPFLVVDDLVIAAGEVTRDPRIERIDLRGRLRPIPVRVVGPEGRPLPEARLSVDSAGPEGDGRWYWVTTTDGYGQAVIWSPGDRERVLVTCEGYRDESLTLGAAGARIALKPSDG